MPRLEIRDYYKHHSITFASNLLHPQTCKVAVVVLPDGDFFMFYLYFMNFPKDFAESLDTVLTNCTDSEFTLESMSLP